MSAGGGFNGGMEIGGGYMDNTTPSSASKNADKKVFSI